MVLDFIVNRRFNRSKFVANRGFNRSKFVSNRRFSRREFLVKHGIRWISNWKVERMLGVKSGLFYERIIKSGMVRRWFLLKNYWKDIRRSRIDRYARYLIFKEVKNNVMGTLVDYKGRVLIKKIGGEVGFKGSKRNSSSAAYTVGVVMGKLASKRRIRKVVIRLKGRVTNKSKLFYRGFFRGRIRIGKIYFRYSHVHESVKVKKERRV